jgi:hypothetical protein
MALYRCYLYNVNQQQASNMNVFVGAIAAAAVAKGYEVMDVNQMGDGWACITLYTPQESTLECFINENGIVEAAKGCSIQTGDWADIDEDEGRDLSTPQAVEEFLESYKEW